MEREPERLIRCLAHLNDVGVLDCRNPMLAAHQFMGMLNELSLWPWLMGRRGRIPVSSEDVVEESIRMFLGHYRRAGPKKAWSR
jgi:hypothetical protein